MSRRHDVQEGTGRIEYLAGRGTVQAWGPGSQTSGTPTNGVKGFAPACTWQDLANGKVYVNQGSFTSSLWIEDDGGPGSSIIFGSVGNLSTSSPTMLGSGNIYRFVSGTGAAPAATGADTIVDQYSLPANTLDGVGNRGFCITVGGSITGSDASTAKIIIGGSGANGSTITGGTTIATTGSMSQSSKGWLLQAQVFKYGAANANTQIFQEMATVVATTHGGCGAPGTLTLTENAAIQIAITINVTTTATDCALWWWEITATN